MPNSRASYEELERRDESTNQLINSCDVYIFALGGHLMDLKHSTGHLDDIM